MSSRKSSYFPAYAILFIAALTRLPQMAWRSFDADEGTGIYFSDLPYRELFTHMADLTLDRHPLFSYVVLKFWRQLGGDSDVALRLLSVLLGILTVAIVYRIGADWFGRTRAAVAALVFALNPLVIYQHQDARMYALALFLTALAVWLSNTVRRTTYPRKLFLLLIIAAAVVTAVYSHILALTVLPIVAVLLLRDFRRRLPLAELGTLGTIGLLILPYIFNIYTSGNQGSGALDPGSWWRTLLGGAKSLFDNQNVLIFNGNEILLTLLLLLVPLAALWRTRRRMERTLLLLFWLAASLLMVMYVMMQVEFFTSKPLVFVAVPLAILTAVAITGHEDRLRWEHFPLLAALVGLLLAGQQQMHQPQNLREDFRTAAQFLEQHTTTQDAVIVHLNWYQIVVGHYLQRPFAAPFSNNVQSTAEVEAGFAPYLDSEMIWLIQAGLDAASSGLPTYRGDQERLVQRWLEERYPLVTEVYPAGVTVKGYALAYRLNDLPPAATSLDISYGDVTLVGYRLARTDFPTQDEYLHPPSTWIPLTLYWSADQPLTGDVTPVITLEDETGGVWGGVLERDNDLRAFYPPPAWQSGEIVRWDFDLVINPQVPPGSYKLVVRLFDSATMTPILHEGGQDWLILERVNLNQ